MATDSEFVSHIYLRPKKDGSQRPIFNLKALNNYVQYHHFKMEGMPMVKNLLRTNDWLLKVDLKDAYLCVPMAKQHQKYLKFRWGEKLYQFQCLPFGLASAPRDFTKVMKPIVGLLRGLGVRMVVYLDDILLINQDPEILQREGKTLCHLLERLGFIVNMKKSVLVPSQKVEFLGMMVDTCAMQLSLPKAKVVKIRQQCSELVQQKRVTVRALAKLIGVLSSTMQAVLPAPLHYRELQMLKTRGLMYGKCYGAIVTLTPECLTELRWWMLHLDQCNAKSVLSPGPDLIIESDASRSGWGAAAAGQTVRGHWTPEELQDQINALELRAVWLAVRSFASQKSNAHIHVRVDNRTAMAHINRMGGTRSKKLIGITRQLWQFCLDRKISLSAEYVPGKFNVEADRLSRMNPEASDWQLNKQVFVQLERHFGPFSWDLFASRQNAQLTRFVSWKLDPDAAATDALQQTWTGELSYAFPPFCLIARCLAKVLRDEAEMLLVAPVWPTQPWYPVLLALAVEQPLLLPISTDLLKSPLGQPHPLLQQGTLQLAAWQISSLRRWRFTRVCRATLQVMATRHADSV